MVTTPRTFDAAPAGASLSLARRSFLGAAAAALARLTGCPRPASAAVADVRPAATVDRLEFWGIPRSSEEPTESWSFEPTYEAAMEGIERNDRKQGLRPNRVMATFPGGRSFRTVDVEDYDFIFEDWEPAHALDVPAYRFLNRATVEEMSLDHELFTRYEALEAAAESNRESMAIPTDERGWWTLVVEYGRFEAAQLHTIELLGELGVADVGGNRPLRLVRATLEEIARFGYGPAAKGGAV